MSDPVLLALLTAIGAGCAMVFKYLTSRITLLEDRLYKSMGISDEALDTAETAVKKKARGA